MVLPRDGLKNEKGEPLTYDKVFYIGENDFYIPRDEDGNFKTYECQATPMPTRVEVMRGLVPTHVVFNGAKGALTGDNAMKAKVGETVLIVHSQANRDTRPHLIGGHGDYVWEEGKFANPPAKDLETWFIRGGSAGSGALHVPAAGRLRLCQPQPDRGGGARSNGPLRGRGRMERRPDEAGRGARPDPDQLTDQDRRPGPRDPGRAFMEGFAMPLNHPSEASFGAAAGLVVPALAASALHHADRARPCGRAADGRDRGKAR